MGGRGSADSECACPRFTSKHEVQDMKDGGDVSVGRDHSVAANVGQDEWHIDVRVHESTCQLGADNALRLGTRECIVSGVAGS